MQTKDWLIGVMGELQQGEHNIRDLHSAYEVSGGTDNRAKFAKGLMSAGFTTSRLVDGWAHYRWVDTPAATAKAKKAAGIDTNAWLVIPGTLDGLQYDHDARDLYNDYLAAGGSDGRRTFANVLLKYGFVSRKSTGRVLYRLPNGDTLPPGAGQRCPTCGQRMRARHKAGVGASGMANSM